MNQRQNAQLHMIRTVLATAAAEKPKWQADARFAGTITALENLEPELSALLQQQRVSLPASTAEKNAALQTAVGLAKRVADVLILEEGSVNSPQAVRVRSWKLKHNRKATAVVLADLARLQDMARETPQAFPPDSADAQLLARFELAVANFRDVLTLPRQTRVERSTATATMAQLFRRVTEALDLFDRAVNRLEESQPTVALALRHARRAGQRRYDSKATEENVTLLSGGGEAGAGSPVLPQEQEQAA